MAEDTPPAAPARKPQARPGPKRPANPVAKPPASSSANTPGPPAPRAPPAAAATSAPKPATVPDRRRFQPMPIAALVPGLTRPAFKRRSPAGAMLLAEWPAVVGPALAAVTTPRQLSRGTLTLGCAGPVAMELTHMAPQLIARINGHCGQLLVERLRFVQAPGAAPRAAAPRAAAVALPEAVDAALVGIGDAGLRAALAKLGQGVYRRR